MKMQKALALGVGTAMLLPALAFAAATVDFSGYAEHNGPAPGEYAVGVTYAAYTTLNTVQPDPWYPFNQAQFEYTAVIQAAAASWAPLVSGVFNIVDFAPASFAIYEDDTTPASYGDKSTFTDGVLLLEGTITNMHGERLIFNPHYNVTGDVEITGGAGIGNALCTHLVMNDFITVDFFVGGPPATYEEGYDPQWICATTSVEDTSWGRVKELYR